MLGLQQDVASNLESEGITMLGVLDTGTLINLRMLKKMKSF